MTTLAGFKIIEIAALGPAPFCGMMLADMGAEVVQVRRPGNPDALVAPEHDILNRGRTPLVLDLKSASDVARLKRLIAHADGLIEGFRPGVMERIGLGPEDCRTVNPGLVYGRVTGWGQSGPLAARAGHDINYLGLSGALGAIGRADSGPIPPLNLVADFGGGGMLLTVGMLSALLERQRSGRGQVVDAAMVDGCALQMALIYSLKNMGAWTNEREHNLLDGGAPFYDAYRCADNRYLAVGAIEPMFYRAFLRGCELDIPAMQEQWNRDAWPGQKQRVAATLARRTRDEWMQIFAGQDACVSPVLSLDEAPADPHLQQRGSYFTNATGIQPAPAPRFSRTPGGDCTAHDPATLEQRWGMAGK